jgi:hypothetical protein
MCPISITIGIALIIHTIGVAGLAGIAVRHPQRLNICALKQ